MVSVSLGSILLVSTGCSTSTPGGVSGSETGPKVNGPTLTWSKVVLPRDVEPLTLTASGPQLLVGGRSATGRVKPRLLRIASDGSSREVQLVPRSGYAFEARWRSIASDGNRIIAVGGAPGGAHSNTRWTTWAGTNAGVTEIPQPFDTFGGWGAGDVIGPVLTTAGPVIAGSWAGASWPCGGCHPRLSPGSEMSLRSPRIQVPRSRRPLVSGAGIIEVVSAGPNVVVLAGGDQHWALSRGPVGRATSSAVAGGWLYVIAEPAVGPGGLWRCPVKDLG